MSLSFTKNVLQALNEIPEMNRGMYTRFSVILYQLVKEYHPTIDVELVYTGQDVAVITINDFVINPYEGITLVETGRGQGTNGERIKVVEESLEEFTEAQPPTGPEVMKFLGTFMELLKDLEKSTPLSPEIFLKRQSKFYTKDLAVDITLEECKTPNPGIVYKKKPAFSKYRPTGKPDFVFETKYRFPNVSGLDFTVKPVIVNEDLLVVATMVSSPMVSSPVVIPATEETCGISALVNSPTVEVTSNVEVTPNVEVIPTVVNEDIFSKNKQDSSLPDVADLTLHFVKSQPGVENKLFKPAANLKGLDILELYGDFAASGLLSSQKGASVALKIYSKNYAFLTLNPKSLICTLQVLINDNTVNIATEAEESTFNFPLQGAQSL